MLRMLESYGYGYRLYNPKTRKYVDDNAKNRARALFGEIVVCEAKKTPKDYESRYSVQELLGIYRKAVFWHKFETPGKTTRLDLETFIYELDSEIGLGNLAQDENFERLALRVLRDQQNQNTLTNVYDIEDMEKEYIFMNKYIFDGTHKEDDEDDDNSFLLLLNN